jgi:hypothetical protein
MQSRSTIGGLEKRRLAVPAGEMSQAFNSKVKVVKRRVVIGALPALRFEVVAKQRQPNGLTE